MATSRSQEQPSGTRIVSVTAQFSFLHALPTNLSIGMPQSTPMPKNPFMPSHCKQRLQAPPPAHSYALHDAHLPPLSPFFRVPPPKLFPFKASTPSTT
eukprot:1157608-Pelagomonas_calceolata.AAC.1